LATRMVGLVLAEEHAAFEECVRTYATDVPIVNPGSYMRRGSET
jgi:hypothetical protein